jgi:hypothetical protein
MKNLTGIIIGGVLLFFIIVGVSIYFSISNSEVKIREQVIAQQDVCKANFDKMYKTINQVAQTAGQFNEVSKEAFKEIYPSLMEGRYGNARGGALLSMITESNPQFDMKATGKLYENLQNAIEANRSEYFIEQKKLIDMRREHSTKLKTFPGSLFIGSRPEIDIIIITSEPTEATYKSGQENDINLFK